MPLNIKFRFSPLKEGVSKALGPLETEIMKILWQDKRSTVKKVHRKLSQQRDIAYTTVMTTMGRLAEKQVLDRHREGLAYVYTPAISEEEFVTMVVHQVLDGVLDDFSDIAVDYMIDYLAEHDPDQLRRLKQSIESRNGAR